MGINLNASRLRLWDIPHMAWVGETTFQRELARRMKDAGLNAKQLSTAAGLHEAAVSELLRGKSRNPRLSTLQALADVLGCSVDDLVTAPETRLISASQFVLEHITVTGAVQAGHWEMDEEWAGDRHYVISIPKVDQVEKYDRYQKFGLEVKGDSMDLRYAAGSVLICVSFVDLERWPVNGEHVVVRRRSAAGAYEFTVKEVEIRDDDCLLWPRSSNPDHQAPIRIPRPSGDVDAFDGIDDDQIEVIAKVIGAFVAAPDP